MREFAYALKYAPETITFEGTAAHGRFTVRGHYVRVSGLEAALPELRRLGAPLDAEETLRALIPAEDAHPLGRIVARRISRRDSPGFLGTGAGPFEIQEVLVELSSDFEDWRGGSLKTHPAGAQVWVEE